MGYCIRRKWYFLNIIILCVITIATKYIFEDHIIPNITTDVYEIIANGIILFAYVIYAITFFSLIERRLYDVCGKRDSKGYKNTSGFLTFIVIFQIITWLVKIGKINISIDIAILEPVSYILGILFLIIAFFIGLIKGKITNLTYEEYKNKIRYE